jgi:WD40 repeat protein
VCTHNPNILAVGGTRGQLTIWNITEKHIIQDIDTGNCSPIVAIAWRQDGKAIITCSENGICIVHNYPQLERMATMDLKSKGTPKSINWLLPHSKEQDFGMVVILCVQDLDSHIIWLNGRDFTEITDLPYPTHVERCPAITFAYRTRQYGTELNPTPCLPLLLFISNCTIQMHDPYSESTFDIDLPDQLRLSTLMGLYSCSLPIGHKIMSTLQITEISHLYQNHFSLDNIKTVINEHSSENSDLLITW